MANGIRFFLVFTLLGTALAGCAPPCDSYCTTTAAYIERCLADGTQQEWIEAKDSGFGYWGYADAAEFTSDCKADFDGQLSSAADPSVLEQACQDEASEFSLLESRGQCAELP